MPKKVLPLSDIQVKKAKPRSKSYKLADGKGLYLLVTTTGGKLWRFNYRFINKNKTLALGSYPEVTLAEVRKCRDDARQLVAIDSVNKYSILLNSVLFSGYEYYRCSHTQSADAV